MIEVLHIKDWLKNNSGFTVWGEKTFSLSEAIKSAKKYQITLEWINHRDKKTG